jgi:hypothetical protein
MSHILRAAFKDRLLKMADPDCPECSGEGWYTVCWNNNPDREDEMACACVREALEAEDGPADDSEAWSGGFAENH